MSLRKNITLLGSGGGLVNNNRRSGGGEAFSNKGYYSPVAQLNVSYAGHMSKPHRAGIPNRNLYMTRTTMGMHQMEHPQWQKLGFVEHITLEEEMKQIVNQSPMVPTLMKSQYENWKIENIEEVKKHAGRYAVVSWDLETKTGGIEKSYSSDELYTSDPKLTSHRWLDYIQVGYGTETRLNILPEDPHDWNTTDYPSLDGTKEWCNYTDRESWTQAPQSTPVSKRIKRNDPTREIAKPIPRKDGLPKWLTFASEFGYGSEQFTPWLTKFGHSSSDACNDMEILHKTRQQHLGFVPRLVTNHFLTIRPAWIKHKPFGFTKTILRRGDTVTRTTPSGSEVWVTKNTQMLQHSRNMIQNKSCWWKQINHVMSCEFSVNHGNVECGKFTKFRHPQRFFRIGLKPGF